MIIHDYFGFNQISSFWVISPYCPMSKLCFWLQPSWISDQHKKVTCPVFCINIWYLQTQLLQQNQNISCWYCDMRNYQNPAVNMRNRLATWTEQSVGWFSSHYVSFSARVLHLTFSWCSLRPEPFPVFFYY